MKFAMNGAITIGTFDGANIEIRDAVGHENFFLFGLTAEEVERHKAEGYRPCNIYELNSELREAIDLISSGFFSNGDRGLFQPLVESLLTRDDYMLLADYQDYVECQQRVSQAYADRNAWTRMSILNCARVAASRPTARSGSIAATFGRSRRLFLTKEEPDADHKHQPRCRAGCERSSRRDGPAGRCQFQRVLQARCPARAAAVR